VSRGFADAQPNQPKVVIDPGFPGQVHVAADGTVTISGPARSKDHKVTLYQKSFSVGSSEHRGFMSTLPGAEVRKNDVHLSVRPEDIDDTFLVIETVQRGPTVELRS
jgi:hypothetical protein